MKSPLTKKISKKVENLFDQEDQILDFKLDAPIPFEVEPNHILLERIRFSPGDVDWTIFFSRLLPFFEMGLLIDGSEIKKLFYKGKELQQKLHPRKIKLPRSPYFTILKTNAKPFLEKLRFQHIENSDRMSCLVIRLGENNYIALLTWLAEPWLSLRCESLQKALTQQDYYCDFVTLTFKSNHGTK